jgi:hypothetical protein
MAEHAELVLRQRFCAAAECGAAFLICARCDRGHRYCSVSCRETARRHQRRCANRRHQQSPEGRLDHRDRQRQYRERQAEARVTDQGSLSILCPASFGCGAERAVPAHRETAALLRRRPENQPGLWLRCRICGRAGRFIDPFPRIPTRR